jgi:hypothetical protein
LLGNKAALERAPDQVPRIVLGDGSSAHETIDILGSVKVV